MLSLKYYKYKERIDGLLGYTYIEAEHNDVLRQISKFDNKIISSNMKDEKFHFCLCDQEIDLSNEAYIPITQEAFDLIWLENINKNKLKWKNIKDKYKIGEMINGSIEVFYPQGVIISINDDTIGITDYNECKESHFEGVLSSGRMVRSTVTGYDETNLWVVLGNTKIL